MIIFVMMRVVIMQGRDGDDNDGGGGLGSDRDNDGDGALYLSEGWEYLLVAINPSNPCAVVQTITP